MSIKAPIAPLTSPACVEKRRRIGEDVLVLAIRKANLVLKAFDGFPSRRRASMGTLIGSENFALRNTFQNSWLFRFPGRIWRHFRPLESAKACSRLDWP